MDLNSTGCMDPIPERTEWPQKKKKKEKKVAGLRSFILPGPKRQQQM
jgi:hypothetical protein